VGGSSSGSISAASMKGLERLSVVASRRPSHMPNGSSTAQVAAASASEMRVASQSTQHP